MLLLILQFVNKNIWNVVTIIIEVEQLLYLFYFLETFYSCSLKSAIVFP